MSSYSHVFLDANALYRLAYSLAYHKLCNSQERSMIRLAMEFGVLRVATALDLVNKAKSVIKDKVHNLSHRYILINELDHALKSNWIELKSEEDLLALNDEVRFHIARRLGNEWHNILKDRDPEDADMLKSAAIVYACNCVIRTQHGYYVPSYFLIVSDDNDVYENRQLLNMVTISLLKECESMFESVKLYNVRKLVSVAKWDGFRTYVRKVLYI